MRVTTEIWVQAFMRIERARGGFCLIASKGAVEAGAIFIVWNDLEGGFSLYGPAPQSMLEGATRDRVFELLVERAKEQDVNEVLDRQRSFDPDIWIVETECRGDPPPINTASNQT